MKTLLVEIISEEIPAGYIQPALDAMAATLGQKLTAARIGHGPLKTFGTPRRLAVMVGDVADKQTSVTTEVTGPPKRVAFDAEGRPTKAAEGFAKTHGISVRHLTTKVTPKGEYVCATKSERGRDTRTLLRTILPEVVQSIPFPKSMRWGDLSLTFARPIHSVVALIDDNVISFALENIRSGRKTLGHRFMHPKPVTLSHASEYVSALKPAFVFTDMAERKEMVRKEVDAAAAALGGRVIADEELLDTVTNLVEYVAVSPGTFDKAFLSVPSEVLITAMREHQKYFAVVDASGSLLPCFIAVNNTPAQDMAVVTAGHERVLRARLTDARFFYEVDSKTPLSDMMDKLKGVTFQAKLGSVHEKVLRVQKLAEYISEQIGPLDTSIKPISSRAAGLCKFDLTSQMVGEFPKLQGIMGRVYAKKAGEPDAVAQAIEEHYLPTHAGGRLPTTLPGAIVSMADKMDSICSCFGIRLIPTGTTDPYALRRQALGIVQILLNRNLSVSLSGLIQKSVELLTNKISNKISKDRDETVQSVLTFFSLRVEYLLAEQGFAKDLISAVVSASVDDIPSVAKRIAALQALKAKPDFDPLAIAFKRVVNIIKQAVQRGELAQHGQTAAVDQALFQDDCERALYEAFQLVKAAVTEDIARGGFDEALLKVAALKTTVDGFFDGVMVLTDDQTVKRNRLALLKEIADLFAAFADFSKIST
jgi:glycyl-tRNA synthetase beta chain